MLRVAQLCGRRRSSTLAAVTETAAAALTEAHALSGAPWWAVIVAATVGARLCLTLPLAIATQTLGARAVNAAADAAGRRQATAIATAADSKRKQLDFADFRAALAAAHAADDAAAAARHRAWRMLALPWGGRIPAHFFLPWLQIPLWVSASLTLRSMAAFPALGLDTPDAPVAGFATGGPFVFENLAAPDPYYILPTAVVLLNVLNLEFLSLTAPTEAKGAAKYLTNGLRLVSVLTYPILTAMPSALTLYWATSAAYGFAQSVALRVPAVRRTLRIPWSKAEDAPTVFALRKQARLDAERNDAARRS